MYSFSILNKELRLLFPSNIPYSPLISSSTHLSGSVFLPQLDQHQLVDALTDHDVDVEEEEEDVEQDDDTSGDSQVNEGDEHDTEL